MENKINKNELEILNSDEFDSLLDSAELMAKSQGNLYCLDKTVAELRNLLNNGIFNMPIGEMTRLNELVENMETLVSRISENSISDI